MTLLLYIDPASGALLLQALVALAGGIAAFFRKRIWGTIRRLFGRAPAEAPDA